MKSCLIFDLDGTLVDSRKPITRCLQHAVRELGGSLGDDFDLSWCMGIPLRKTLAKLLGPERHEDVERAVELYRARYDDVGLTEGELFNGVRSLLFELLKQNRRLFVATVKPTKTAKKILAYFDLVEPFECIHGSVDGVRGEKHAIIEHVMNVHALDQKQSLMIGDHLGDIEGARANSIDCVAVTYGVDTQHDFRNIPLQVCTNVDDLRRTLLNV